MNINREDIENYLDIIIRDCTDITKFSIMEFLRKSAATKELRENDSQLNKIGVAILSLGQTYHYFEIIGNGNFRLTEKGIAAKDIGGHFKYQKSLKRPILTLFEKISTFLLVITFLLAIYQSRQKDIIERKLEGLEKHVDSLKTTFPPIPSTTHLKPK